MATKTSLLGLTKPEGSDKAQVSVINDNMDKIDTAVQSVNTAVQQRSRVWNLLDNSDFRNPVNQRGSTTYTGTGSYTVDRWYIDAANNSATVNSDRLTMKTVSGSAYATISQKVANASKLAGKTLTFAARVYSNVVPGIRVYRGSNSIVAANGSAAKNSVLVCSFTVPDGIADGELIVKILNQSTQANDYVSVYWASLYEGEYTAETLPAYVPKGYATELLECQRYYYSIPDNSDVAYVGFSASATMARVTIQTPVPMIAKPTIKVGDVSKINLYAETNPGPTTAINCNGYDGNAVTLYCTTSNMAAWKPCVMRFNTTAALSADL